MTKPTNIEYAVDEAPPLGLAVLMGLQHIALMAIYLVYPVLVAQAAGAGAATAAAMVSLTLAALAIGTLVQVIPIGRVGSGFLCQPSPTVLYLVPSLIAAKAGGLPVVFGMTVFAGALQMCIGGVMRHLRSLLPPEITGVVVLLIGIGTGVVGVRYILAPVPPATTVQPLEVTIAVVTLAIMVALNVWGRGPARIFCVLIGMSIGLTVAFLLGAVDANTTLVTTHLVGLPDLSHIRWDFDVTLAIPFAIAAIASSLKVTGNVTTAQKANDAEWIRPDMRSITGGVLADGVASIVAGGLGTAGINSSTAAVGLANATGVLSRRIAYPIAAILLVLALVPQLGMLFYVMPRGVAGAALVFSATFIVVNGFEIIASRMLDARKTLVIGLALVFGLATEIYPGLFESAFAGPHAVLGSSMVLGTITALVLNALFRVGVRRTERLTLALEEANAETLARFIDGQGARWGARREVIGRARFNLMQSVEVIVGDCEPTGPLTIEASFDEFRLDVRVSYTGAPVALSDTLPTGEEIEAEDGHLKLAGYLLRRYADRVSATHRDGRSTILFHFDH